MASVYKRQFRYRVSTKHLLDGETEIITSHGSSGTTVDISVFDICDGGDWERDTLTRYLFRLTVEEASDLTKSSNLYSPRSELCQIPPYCRERYKNSMD